MTRQSTAARPALPNGETDTPRSRLSASPLSTATRHCSTSSETVTTTVTQRVRGETTAVRTAKPRIRRSRQTTATTRHLRSSTPVRTHRRDLMWRYFQQSHRRGLPVTEAALDRAAGTRNYGRVRSSGNAENFDLRPFGEEPNGHLDSTAASGFLQERGGCPVPQCPQFGVGGHRSRVFEDLADKLANVGKRRWAQRKRLLDDAAGVDRDVLSDPGQGVLSSLTLFPRPWFKLFLRAWSSCP
jgi:hypothetical protein